MKTNEIFKYELLEDGTYAIIGMSEDLRIAAIPNTHYRRRVTSIGDGAFSKCSSLISIVIPDSITRIGNSAFFDCSSLTGVIIPDSVTSIGNGAFAYCSSLTNVVIPNRVISIGRHAFLNCSSLTNIVIPDGITGISNDTFSGCSSLTKVVIPDSVTWIGRCAFANCSSLTNIVIPNNVARIGIAAFGGCTSLTNIVIPDSVRSIEECAFRDCPIDRKPGFWKAIRKSLCCRHYQFIIGEWHEESDAVLCQQGFHFCCNPFDLFNYYSGELGKDLRIFKVEAEGISNEKRDDSKRVCKRIKLVQEITSYAELLNEKEK